MTTAADLARRLAAGEVTAVALAEEALSRIEELNPQLNAVLHVERDAALAEAAEADKRREAGRALSDADGIPVLIKDNICSRGTTTSCASRMLENYRPPYDAGAVDRLRAAGVTILGKTNMDEFAMGSSTEHSAFGVSKNPWDPERVPGGSSGGSAVAVASGMVPWTLGSDTGGSIRQPAGFCGVVGLKPTYGRVSRYGLVAFASSLDQIGPFANTVEDAAFLLELVAGHDGRDSTSGNIPAEPYRESLTEGDFSGLKVGRPKQFFEVDGLDPAIRSACEDAIAKMADGGAEIVDVDMPHATDYAIAAYYVIATAEASSNLARYDGAHYGHRKAGTQNIVEMFSKTRAEGFGDEVKRRIMLGTFVLSAETFDAYYLRAQKVRTLIRRDYDNALAKCDLIAAPTSPTTAFRVGDKTGDPLQMYLADIFTLSLNLSGYCGLSMPVGFDDGGLPVGMQLFGGPYQEARLLQMAHRLEKALAITGTRTPQLAAS